MKQIKDMTSREAFEHWISTSVKKTQPWSPTERSGIEEDAGYLDLYTQKKWEGWQAAWRCLLYS